MTDPAPNGPMPTQDRSHVGKAISALWQRHVPEVEARLLLLERASLAATNGDLSPLVRAEAAAVAHTLAGSLGMYGHAHGTKLARSIEQLLEADKTPNPALLRALAMELRHSLPL